MVHLLPPIEDFLDWVVPYSDTEGFVGYTRCDELPHLIDLIYFENNTAYFKTINFQNNPPTVEQQKVTKDKTPPKQSD